MKFRKTTVEDVFQIKPGLDFKIADLVKVESGSSEGFYIERYAPLELKPGEEYNIFKRDLCGRVKYFATRNKKVNLSAIAKLQAIVTADIRSFN